MLTRAVAGYIESNKLAFRYGADPNHAAYALTDIIGEGSDASKQFSGEAICNWVNNPTDLRYWPRWDQHLYNTCFLVFDLALEPYENVLLCTSRNLWGGERYRCRYPEGEGERWTFAKINSLVGSETRAEIGLPSVNSPQEGAEHLRQVIYAHLTELAHG